MYHSHKNPAFQSILRLSHSVLHGKEDNSKEYGCVQCRVNGEASCPHRLAHAVSHLISSRVLVFKL